MEELSGTVPGWQEFYLGWQLNIDEIDSADPALSGEVDRTYGTGTRVFKQILGGTDVLPSLGDPFVDPTMPGPGVLSGENLEYADIVANKFTFTHEFIQSGSSNCETGRICTVSYGLANTSEFQDDELNSPWSGSRYTVLIPSEDSWTYYPNTDIGEPASWNETLAYTNLLEQDVPLSISQGTFNRRVDFEQYPDFTAWLTTFATMAGKVNDEEFMGFPVGCVLCASFSKDYISTATNKYVHRVEIQFEWMVIPGVTHDCWNVLPNPKANGAWQKIVKGTRDPSTGKFSSIESSLYEYGDFTELFPLSGVV